MYAASPHISLVSLAWPGPRMACTMDSTLRTLQPPSRPSPLIGLH